MRRSFLGMLRPLLAMLSLVLTTPRQSRGCAVAFAATLCESVDAIHEESHGHHALHRVSDPSRARGSERVGSSSERKGTRHAYVAMARESLETS
jgi:hypothetical protein